MGEDQYVAVLALKQERFIQCRLLGQTIYVFDKAGTDMTKFKDLFYMGKAKAMCYILENNYSNGYQEEIAYRSALRKKVTGGVKLSKEERLWLETHKEFSQIYGVPILKTDVITLEKGRNYQFDVNFVESLHLGKIYPWFKAPYEGHLTYQMSFLRKEEQ